MRKNANDSANKRRGYNNKEYETALSLVAFLYEMWREHLKNAIIEVDKTTNENGEPTNVD